MNTCKHKLTRRQVEEGMEQHEGLIHAFIRRQGGGEISYEEALQAGRMGLWRALRGYDPARGTAFSTYAWVVICRQIRQRERELHREGKSWRLSPAGPRPEPDPETWVEEKAGEVVGFVALSETMVEQMYVRPGRTGEGIGSRLLARAKAQRPEGLGLWTFQVNDGARRFYERHGFVAVEFGEGDGNEEGQPDVRFAWRPGS